MKNMQRMIHALCGAPIASMPDCTRRTKQVATTITSTTATRLRPPL